MPYFSSAARKLEFEKIVQRIGSLASTGPGKSLCLSIVPSNDVHWINNELRRVDEAKELLIAEGTLPLEGLKDIRGPLKKTTVEHQSLTPAELLDVATCLRVSRLVQAFLQRRRHSAPELAKIASTLYSDKVVEFNISEAIDESGQIRDSASKELRTVRHDIATLREQLRKRLAEILRKVAEQEIAQEDIITTRDGRFVIPVKTEFKHRVAGFIHSTSASGATVFVEPAETLDVNNSVRELQFREQREVDRILKELTGQVETIKEPLENSLSTLALIDLLAAKARYSIETMGSAPRINRSGIIKLTEARHPILLQSHDRSAVVPLSLEMGGDVKTLIITGPNAGGKSVALKTVGLLAMLAQSGVHIPASPDSELPIFENLFVDMGDDQSIENDLSTFSSHLMTLRGILEKAGRDSLVLIDEVGAGTDPAEGGALASSILLKLHEQGALTIATTHHGILKVFAHETPGMANASMEFDQNTLSPTYRFRFGVPGSSYALELAERMGLDQGVLEAARSALGEQKTKLESLIMSLEQEIENHRSKVAAAESERRTMEELKRSYEAKMEHIRDEIRELRSSAKAEVQSFAKEAQARIEHTVRQIRESGASKSSIKSAKETIQGLLEDASNARAGEPMNMVLQQGDSVRLKGTTEVGELVRLEDDTATVLWRNGTMKVRPADLERAAQPRDNEGPSFFIPETQHELDLRGLSGEEAVAKVRAFLDDAFVSGLHRVDIIHGKGTGTLRKRIADLLKDYPHIKGFRLGEWNEGGSGVTVVEISES